MGVTGTRTSRSPARGVPRCSVLGKQTLYSGDTISYRAKLYLISVGFCEFAQLLVVPRHLQW